VDIDKTKSQNIINKTNKKHDKIFMSEERGGNIDTKGKEREDGQKEKKHTI
jgi:hypothetical protein